MSTTLLYRSNTYQKEFTATVKSCIDGKNGYEIILDQTNFYPEGGGQPCDFGTIDGIEVLDVREKEGEVIHICNCPIEVGKNVPCTINWQRRFDHMQHHSGEHIVSGIVHKNFGFDNVGFHMGTIVTVDFNGELTQQQVKEIEIEANQIIYDNLLIEESYPSENQLSQLQYRSKKELTGQVRIISIPKADICACCGTHVKRTGEIGLIKLSDPVKYKGGVRIEIICGRKALLDYGKKNDINSEISHLLSAKPLETFEAVKQKCDENTVLKQKLKETQSILFNNIAKEYENGKNPLFLFNEGLDGNEIRELCLSLTKLRDGAVLIVSCSSDNQYKFALGIKKGDLREKCKEFLKTLNGKGGGAPTLLQGTLNAKKEEIEKLFLEIF